MSQLIFTKLRNTQTRLRKGIIALFGAVKGWITEKYKFYTTKKGVVHFFSSPTFIWFSSLYLSSLFMLIGFNIARVGFTVEGIFGGPAHYMQVFLTYGLNASSHRISPYFSGILPWLLAPFTIVFMGLALFILTDGGFANNGVKKDPLGSLYYAFFKTDVFGFEVHFFGDKINLFYVGLIWTPIITASIVTFLAKRRLGRDTSVVTRFFINFIISMIISNELARMSDPDLSYSWSGFIDSIFTHRKFNRFVVFNGLYHPTATGFFFTLIQIIPMLILGAVEASIAATQFYLRTRKERAAFKKEQRQQLELDEDSDVLPWEKDHKIRKEESKKKKEVIQ